jgi:O-antigen ligase
LGLLALALLVSVPFLLPWHTTPIPTFYSEWWAAALGLVASLALLGARSLPLPGAALLALALAAIVLLQTLLGLTALPPLAMLSGSYLLWAALLACTGNFLAAQVGQAKLARILASAILLGSLLAALLSLLQPWLFSFGWTGFAARHGGPLGQTNQFTNYLWLGLASALYLHVTAALPRRAFWAAATLLTLTAALVGQRSAFLYAVALIGVTVWQARNAPSDSRTEARRLAVGMGLLFVLMQPLVMLFPTWGDGDAKPPSAMRVAQMADQPSVRLQLWRVGWEGIAAAPLFGHGVGSYPGLALAHADTIPAEANPGPAESAHNLLIDLSVEFGVPVALLVLLAAGFWLLRLRKNLSPEVAWATAIMVMLCLYSLIEYPLWHTYFLGLLAIVAGAFGSGRQIGQRLTPVALAIGLLVWGSLALVEIRRDYQLLEVSLALGKQPATLSLAQSALLRIPQTSLLSPWVNTTACVSLDPLRVPLEDGLAVCRIAMRFAPAVESGVNAAVLQWRAGDVNGAREFLRRLKLATQYNPKGVDTLLAQSTARDMHLSELLIPPLTP